MAKIIAGTVAVLTVLVMGFLCLCIYGGVAILLTHGKGMTVHGFHPIMILIAIYFVVAAVWSFCIGDRVYCVLMQAVNTHKER
jgi:uncharacterized membrane protein